MGGRAHTVRSLLPAPTPMNIRVLLPASDLDELYTQPTREFGELIGSAGHTLVGAWFDTGLMKFADGVQASGGRLAGISVDPRN